MAAATADSLHEKELIDLANQIEQVKNGTHPELLKGYSKLEKEKAKYLHTVESTRTYCLDGIKKEHKQEQQNYAATLKKSRIAARKRLISELEAEKQKTKHWFDTSKIDEFEHDSSGHSRKTRRTRGDATNQEDAGASKQQSSKETKPDSALPVFTLELDEADIQHDVRIFKEGSKKSKGSSQSIAPVKEIECYYEHQDSGDDRLKYDARWYHRGYKVTVERPKSSVKVTGHIFMFTPQEVWLRKQDLSKYGFRISELAKGKLTMRPATGRT